MLHYIVSCTILILFFSCCSVKPEDLLPSRLYRRTGMLRHRVRYENYHLDSSILMLVLLTSTLSLQSPASLLRPLPLLPHLQPRPIN